MTDTAVALLAYVIAGAHVLLYVVGWVWAARSRHLGFLVLMAPTAIAWSLAGFPLVRAMTYGTREFGPPVGGLQTAGYVAILAGFGGFFLCALGALVTLLFLVAKARRKKPVLPHAGPPDPCGQRP